jgi:hypothetical protein
LFISLTAQEQLRADGSGRYGIDGDVSAADFVSEHMNQAFDSSLRGDIRTIGRKRPREHAAGKRNDPPAAREALCGLSHDQERSAQVGLDHPIEQRDIALPDRRERHDTGIVHHDIDRPEGFYRLIKHLLDLGRVPDVGLHGDRLSAIRLDLRDCRIGFRRVVGIVDDHGEAVAC